ncbi:MAG: TonB-dependent receptor [Sinobacteraceae bacterium]|nr:TonB-dependent receptor [Nevskiaceae bacterium]
MNGPTSDTVHADPTSRWLVPATVLVLCGLAGNPVSAQESSDSGSEAGLDTIVVVGSRAGNATILNSAAPVQVVSSAELLQTGARTLSEALQSTVPSFNFPTSVPSSNAASFVKGVALRGLAADQTLVLVNGKRRHATAQLNAGSGTTKGAQTVDFNSIPLNAIARVEVLLDGAAAQYGSDAIAGVVNIVLKEQAGGSDFSLQFGRNENGDGDTGSLGGSFGTRLPGEGFLTVSFDAWDIDPTRLSVRDTRQMYFAGDPRESSYPYRDWFYGSGASERYNLFVNAESKLGGATVYGFGSYGWREDDGFGNLRQPNADQTVRALYPDGFQPLLNVQSRDASITAGVKFGNDSVGRFDLSATYGRNLVESVVSNTNNASLGLASPASFDTGDLLNVQSSINLDWTREVALANLLNPLNLSAGITYRHEAYEVFEGAYGSWANGGVPILDGPNAGRVATPASQGFGGFSPDDAGRLSRDVYGGYVDVEIRPNDRFKVALAARSEHYSDFGATTNGRLALRYELLPQLAWRGSFSSGYRAPSLGQSAYSRTIPNITNGVLSTNRIAPVDSALARALGATALTPEESTSFSTGLVWVVDDRASLTVDVYRTEIDDRIALSEVLRGTTVTQALTAAGYPTYSGLQFFTNAVDTRTRGVEIVGRYGFRPGGGNALDFSLGYSRSETEITAFEPTPGVLAGSGLALIGREAIGLIERGNPESFLRLAADYKADRFSAQLSGVRYGSYSASHTSNPALDQKFGEQIVVNLHLGYRFSDAIHATVGANNLFGSHPDQVIAATRNPVVAIYSGLSPEGGAGAIYYARLNFKF